MIGIIRPALDTERALRDCGQHLAKRVRVAVPLCRLVARSGHAIQDCRCLLIRVQRTLAIPYRREVLARRPSEMRFPIVPMPGYCKRARFHGSDRMRRQDCFFALSSLVSPGSDSIAAIKHR